VPRSGSPAFGSPIRLEAGRAEEEEELAAVRGTLEVEVLKVGVDETVAKKEKRKSKAKEQRESESEKDGTAEIAVRHREKKRPREEDGSENAKSKQKDASTSRTALQPIDNNVYEQNEPAKQFLRPTSPSGHSSSSPAPPNFSETDGQGGGRERRTRKSVNYAEPKLNTKMRKPDPLDSSSSPSQAIKRKKSRPQVLLSDSDSDGADADEEYVAGRRSSGSSGPSDWINVGGRRKTSPKRNAAVVAVTAIEDIRTF